ncbi:probable disease resistance protein RF9 [Brassica napus]|uniref:probable disease resistance protein RF9 n=1 Tax=Brassica napus TaxID=3708 RepID=UPI002079002D|nr:probable disease resistance protein RF9 [Brassica napus]
MAITGHPGAYLHVEEAILLETLQLAFDLRLVISKRGHDPCLGFRCCNSKRRLMAELAVALLPFAVERLWNLLVRVTGRFQGVEEQFEGLKSDVKKLRFFLEDAEAKKHTSAVVKDTIKEINEVVLDAEDIIQTFLLKKELGESSSSSVKRFAYASVKSMVLGFDMKTISKRISKVILDMQKFGVQNAIVNEEDMKSVQLRERKMREMFCIVDEKVYSVLYLSSEELPAYLKQCFLYLASFPEDYKIDVETLSYYWAVEGILMPMYFDGVSIRHIADICIEELVKRHMVISERYVKTLRFETLQLHDMMREVCLRKAEEENFVQTIDTSTANSKSPSKSRRLAETFSVDKEVKNPSLRTLLFIKCSRWKATSLLFTMHKLMRVLDLSGVEFEGGKVPSNIGKLIHLRYLSLYEAHVTQLPSSMRNLKKLLYLNLAVYVEVYMPNNILNEMRELTFLCLPERLHVKTKLELENLVKLETLKNFCTEHGRVTDLQGLTRLRSLSIYITDERYTMETLSSSLSKLSHLESLTIYNKFYTPTNDDEEGFVWDFVNLKQLKLEIYMPRLPDAQCFPSHLTTIELTYCCLKEDPMPILEKLLHLKEICLGGTSFCGRRMVCSSDGFTQLQKLIFGGLTEWEEWIVEEGSMPLLHTLDIGSCKKLKELPYMLRFITNLEDLSVHDMGDEFNLRLSEGYFPSHLTTISLSGCCLTEDPMPILEKLLQLKEVILKNNSFCGRRMVCSRDGFPQLQKLQLEGLEEWEEWIIEEGSMPLLHTLRFGRCLKLKELPDGLRFITSLKSLICHDMGKRWEKRLSDGGEDYYKVQHIPSVQFDDSEPDSS